MKFGTRDEFETPRLGVAMILDPKMPKGESQGFGTRTLARLGARSRGSGRARIPRTESRWGA